MRSFTSHPAEPADNEEAPDITADELEIFSFGLDEATFTCALRTDADALIEWSEFAAAVLDSDIDSESPEGVALTSKLLRLAMPNGEYRRFRSHLRQQHTKPDVLIQVLQCINEEMEKAVAKRTRRPTGQPSPSSAGASAQDARVSKVISLQAGDVTVIDMPQPQDHKPKADGRTSSAKQVRGAGRKRTATAG